MVSLALLEKDVAAIYVDTSNYVNADNINLCVKNFMNDSDHKAKADRAQETLGRLRVIKIFNLDELLVLLAMILEQLRAKKLTFDLRLIVIDSLSSLFAPVPHKQHQYFQLIKELLFYFKSLNKKHFVSVVYTNNSVNDTHFT